MSNSPGNIQALINGERRQMLAGRSLLSLVEELGIKPDRVAIELDRKIIRPLEWAGTEIRDGAEIEIVHFVGGG